MNPEGSRETELWQPGVFLSHLQSTANGCYPVMPAHCCHTFWIFKRGWKFRFFNLLYRLSKTDRSGKLYLNHTAQSTLPIGHANSKRNGKSKCSFVQLEERREELREKQQTAWSWINNGRAPDKQASVSPERKLHSPESQVSCSQPPGARSQNKESIKTLDQLYLRQGRSFYLLCAFFLARWGEVAK